MVLVDEILYVFGGYTRIRYMSLGKYSNIVECYNYESDEWNVKVIVFINKIIVKKSGELYFLRYFLKDCFFRVFKGVLISLEFIV